jgi:AbrB family looped-hinge helix DNA binding protein
MASAASRVTAQHQTSIPADVRRRFGIVPGTELVWEERDNELVVRPKRFTLADVRALCAPHREGRKAPTLRAMRAERDAALSAKYGRR